MYSGPSDKFIRIKTQALNFLILTLLALPLQGCLIWETEEVRITLQSQWSGKIEIIFGPVGSDKKEKEERERDFSYLIYDIIENDLIGSPYIKDVKGEIIETSSGIYSKKSGRFDSLEALEQKLEIKLQDNRLIFVLASEDELISTNGKAVENSKGRRVLSWPKNSEKIEYKIRKKGSFLQPAYTPENSLLPEYKTHLNAKNYFKKVYINYKLKYGLEALEKNNFRAAYNNFSCALRVDPKNSKAGKEMEKLAFVPYMAAVEYIPLPYINISIGVDFNTSSIDDTNFMDISREMRKLEAQLKSADDKKKAYIYCRLCFLAEKKDKKSTESEKFMEKALTLYRMIKDKRSLSPEIRMCYGYILRKKGENIKALEMFKEIALFHPQFWPVYGQIVGDYQKGNLPDSRRQMEYWIKRGDSELEKFLFGQRKISAESAYNIFNYIVMRNIIIMESQNISTARNNPVNEMAYKLINHAVLKEPTNPKYRGALGYTQLLILTFDLFARLDPGITNAHDAVMGALDKLNRDKKELMKTAEDILSFLSRELGRKSALHTQNMAFLAFLKKDFANAERLYIEAIEMDPEREDPYIMLTAFYNVIFSEARTIREDKLEILIELLYKKVEMNPTPLDRFIIGKLETQRAYFKEAHKQFMLSVKEDPSYYPSVAGYIKTRLLTSPAETSSIIVEIEEYLAKDYPGYSKDELYFAKGVAFALEGDIKKGLAIIENLHEKTKNSPPEGLAETIGILSQ